MLDQYANLAEILGGGIVLVTLIFLVIQLRQNTRALKSATLQGSQANSISIYQMLVDESMLEVLIKGMPRPSELTPVERGKFNSYWAIALLNYQETYFQIRAGFYEPDLFDGWWQALRNNFLSPGFRLHWEHRSYTLSSEFRKFVDEQIMSREPTAGYAKALAVKGPLTANE